MIDEENSMVVGATEQYESGFQLNDDDLFAIAKMSLEQGGTDDFEVADSCLDDEDFTDELLIGLRCLARNTKTINASTIKVLADLMESVEKVILKKYNSPMTERYLDQQRGVD